MRILRPILIGELIFQNFPNKEMFGNIYQDIYGGVLPQLVVIFFRSNKIGELDFIYLEKNTRKIWNITELREKNMEVMGRNGSSIIMTLPQHDVLYRKKLTAIISALCFCTSRI